MNTFPSELKYTQTLKVVPFPSSSQQKMAPIIFFPCSVINPNLLREVIMMGLHQTFFLCVLRAERLDLWQRSKKVLINVTAQKKNFSEPTRMKTSTLKYAKKSPQVNGTLVVHQSVLLMMNQWKIRLLSFKGIIM